MEKLIKLLGNYNSNLDKIKISDIDTSFEMDKEYFLDVFETRYEISLDLNKPILGLKEVLLKINSINEDKIRSFSIVSTGIDILVYTDMSITEIYGIIDFLGSIKS